MRAASVLATWAASPDAKATTTWVFEQAEDDRPLEAVLRELALAVGSSSASEAMSAIAAPATTVLLGMCESDSLSPRVVKYLHRAAAAGGDALVPGALVQLLERVLTSSPHTHATFCDPPCLALWVQLLQQHRGTGPGTGTDGTALRVFKQLLCMPDRAQQLARGIDVCKFIATLFRIMGAVPGIDSGAPGLEVVLRLVQAAEKNGLPTTGTRGRDPAPPAAMHVARAVSVPTGVLLPRPVCARAAFVPKHAWRVCAAASLKRVLLSRACARRGAMHVVLHLSLRHRFWLGQRASSRVWVAGRHGCTRACARAAPPAPRRKQHRGCAGRTKRRDRGEADGCVGRQPSSRNPEPPAQ